MLNAHNHKKSEAQGFSLIEMLVVISIMAALAGLIVGLGGLASRKSKESRVRAELDQYVTAIQSFKEKFGFYPPDNSRGATNADPAINQLFYELSGVVLTNNMFQTLHRDEQISSANVFKFFKTQGFANSAVDPKGVRNFLPWLKTSQYKEISANPDVEVLVVPVEWPKNRTDQPTPVSGLNPWRYVSTNPTNNPGAFDLWAELWIGGKLKVIGNWKD